MLAYPPIRLVRNKTGVPANPFYRPVQGMMILFCLRNKLVRNLTNL